MKHFFYLILLFASRFAFSQDSLLIQGTLRGQDNLPLFISFTNNEGKKESYRATAVTDVFSFKIKRQGLPVVARLSTALPRNLSKNVNGVNYGSPAPDLEFFIYRSDLKIRGSAADIHLATVLGDKENEEFEAYKSIVKPMQKEEWEIKRLQFEMDTVKDSVSFKKLSEKWSAIAGRQAKIKKNFIEQNPASFTSLFLLSRMPNAYTTDQYEKAYIQLSDGYKNTGLAKVIAERIAYFAPTSAGKPAIPFIKKDKDGKEVRLSDYKGRTVLLDFWGSWCGPCRASHPHLKELYRKYKDRGFEIIAIASETAKTRQEQRTKWLEAIEKDGIHWIHILNNEEAEKQNLVKDYRVSAFPTKILLNEEGTIILRITASATDDIDRVLEKIYDR